MDDQLTEQIKPQLDDLKNAHSRLQEALTAEKTELNRDAAIQRFEFTFELVWKILKNVNFYFGSECNNPRDCFRLAAQNELLANPEEWFNYLKQRNNTVHAYNEEKAREVFSCLPQFSQDIDRLILTIETKIK